MASSDKVYSEVTRHYTTAAEGGSEGYADAVARAFGYSAEELSRTPKDANLGLSCGNPVALSSIREGETVIDLGCGAGFDVFLAAGKVGDSGSVIGVDMNKTMLQKAEKLKAGGNHTNTRFVESHITDMTAALPAADIADCIISNCVVNLVPEAEKQLVFDEMHRLLRPGGRVALSDILAKKPLPREIRDDMALYVGCIAGASQVDDYRRYLQAAGFRDIVILNTGGDLNVYTRTNPDGSSASAGGSGCGPCSGAKKSCCGPSDGGGGAAAAAAPPADVGDLNEWAASYSVYAVKA